MLNKTNFYSEKSIEDGVYYMGLVESEKIQRHTIKNCAYDFSKKAPYYVLEYERYLKTRNFSILLECEGKEFV